MGMVHLDIKPENIFLSIPDSSNPVSPLSCIAEDSVKDEGPQPLYKIGRINMICCVLHVHVCLWVRPLWFLILWEGLTVGGTTMLKHLTSIMRAHTHTTKFL